MCYSPYRGHNPRYALVVAVLIAGIGLPLVFIIAFIVLKWAKTAVAFLFIVLLLSNIAIWRLVRANASTQDPYIALTPNGVIVNRRGIRGEIETVSWDEVKKRYNTIGSGWKFAWGMVENLGLSLPASDARELHRRVLDRVSHSM